MMRLKESFVSLDGLRFHAFHGVLPQERAVGNDYVVDVRAGYDVSSACLTDEVGDTLNYARMFDIVKAEMTEPSKLLERVAWRIGEKLMAEFPSMFALARWRYCKDSMPEWRLPSGTEHLGGDFLDFEIEFIDSEITGGMVRDYLAGLAEDYFCKRMK